jgi:PAS domain S-box-containing protein
MATPNPQLGDVRDRARRLLLAGGAALLLIAGLGLGAGSWVLGEPLGAFDVGGAAVLRARAATVFVIALVTLSAVAAVTLFVWLMLERRLAAVAESRERNRAVVDNMVDGAIHIDNKGRLVALNAAAERMFAQDSAAVRGEPLSVLLAPEHRDQVEALIRDAADGGHGDVSDARELTGQRSDGSRFPLYLAVSEVNIGAQPVFTAIARDLTETRRRMQELAEARDQAMAADRAKSQFLAVMSHEIRTPMNGILGMLDLLRDGSLSVQQREFIDTAEQSSQVLLGIINDILDLSKIEAGKLELQHIDFDLRATVEEVTALAAGHARDKDLEVVSFIEQDVPAGVVGDPFRLRQVLMNLTNNALKFTLRGEVVVHVAAEALTERDVRLRISVRDTGIGIEAPVRERLFKPFSQGDASTTRRFGGTGLGLAISKRLVSLMDGEIGVDSTPGAGSTFWIRLRLPRSTAGTEQPAADLRGVRVLIVDDNATNRLILENYLGNWGATSESVAGGLEALRTLQSGVDSEQPFALAILDMQMPEMDGIELAQRIKGDPALAATRLLMLSSLGFPGADARRAGIGVSLLKPVRQSLLHDAALKVLGVGVGDRRLAEPPPPRAQFRARALVVEDNPVNQRVVVLMLQRFGVEAEVAENGALAVDALAGDHAFDLVFMDMQMPVLGGQEATREIRMRAASTGLPRVPIIAMTASATAADRRACLASGMDDFIAKPVQRGALESALKRWLPQQALPVVAPATAADGSMA